MEFEFLALPGVLLQNMDKLWTLMLLLARFSALLMMIPGLGMGMHGFMVRYPAALVLACAAMVSSPVAPLPVSWADVALQFGGEFMLGGVLGIIPLMVVNGAQMAGQLASTTMGLQASQLIDPTLQLSVPDLARIFGDMVIIIFLFLGGHHVAVHAAAGMGGEIIPGTFFPGFHSAELIVAKSADIFSMGVALSAPVIVALLLTNFVMGLITKAVPTVNVFIISFPLTIGIGLVLSVLLLPELTIIATRQLTGVEQSILSILEETRKVSL